MHHLQPQQHSEMLYRLMHIPCHFPAALCVHIPCFSISLAEPDLVYTRYPNSFPFPVHDMSFLRRGQRLTIMWQQRLGSRVFAFATALIAPICRRSAAAAADRPFSATTQLNQNASCWGQSALLPISGLVAGNWGKSGFTKKIRPTSP